MTWTRASGVALAVGLLASLIPATTLTTAWAASGDTFSPVDPTRILDTRIGLGESGAIPAKLGEGAVISLQVTGGPVPDGVDAVVMNVTVVKPSKSTYVSVYPGDQAQPLTVSNVNVGAGQVVPNLVTVKVDAAGGVNLFNAAGSVDLLADVTGYYSSTAPDFYTPLPPTRILDTRNGTGSPVSPVGPAGSIDLQVTGSGGVPDGADAVVLNVTATGPSSGTYVSVYPTPATSQPPPAVSSLNVARGQTIANLVTVGLGDAGRVRLFNKLGNVNLVADVAGYFSTDTTGSVFTPVTPTRLLDTRTGLGQVSQGGVVGPGGAVDAQLTGVLSIPLDATAAIFNYTGVSPTLGTYLQAYPTPDSGVGIPTVSNLNLPARSVAANLVSVQIGAGGEVRLRNQAGSSHMLVDLAGFYESSTPIDHGTAPPQPSLHGVIVSASFGNAGSMHPLQHTTVILNILTVPFADLVVTARFRAGPISVSTGADSDGLASASIAVGAAPADVVVPLTVTATSLDLQASAVFSTSFTPVAPPPPPSSAATHRRALPTLSSAQTSTSS